MKRILFVITSLTAGGAERQMILLIERLVRNGLQCEVFVLDGSGPLRPRLDALSVRVHDAHYSTIKTGPGRLAAILFGFIRLWWIAIRNKPHVLQAYLPLTNFLGALAGRLAGVPLVITCRRALGTHQDRYPWWRIFDRVTNWLSDIVTANSHAVIEDTIRRDGISADRLVMIRNGLDLPSRKTAGVRREIRHELGLDDEEIGIVNVANLIPYKGHEDLLRAFAMARPSLPPCKLFIVGRDDGIGIKLKKLAFDLGISNSVTFLGYVSDVRRILHATDLFVLASHEEGSSNALLEAMACGLAIIATDVGGNREALEDGRFGSLVPARQPVALAEAIRIQIADISTGRERGIEAANFVHTVYSAQRLSDAYLALYTSRLSPAQALERFLPS